VPVFTEKLKKEGPREAFQVTSTVISILVVVVGALVVIG